LSGGKQKREEENELTQEAWPQREHRLSGYEIRESVNNVKDEGDFGSQISRIK
jgi:hypothetical protein